MLVGILLSVALHVYFVARWDHYVAAIPVARMQQRGGVPPAAHIAGTNLSARDGAAILLLSAVAIALLARRYWIASSGFVAGAATATVSLGVIAGQIRGNLWPLAVWSVLMLAILPIAIGSVSGVILRILTIRRRIGMAPPF
jgi:hypothetical protein